MMYSLTTIAWLLQRYRMTAAAVIRIARAIAFGSVYMRFRLAGMARPIGRREVDEIPKAPKPVIPAKAGIQFFGIGWIHLLDSGCAGMTPRGYVRFSLRV